MCNSCGCDHDSHDHIHLWIPVGGLKCQGCADQIESALNELHGVHATVNLDENTISLVLHDDGASLKEVKAKIRELGYLA